MADIGYSIFVDLLQAKSYPSAPFTGNLIIDLLMFFILPLISIVISFIFWPFLYVKLKNILVGSYHFTKKMLIISFLLPLAAILILLITGYFFSYALMNLSYYIIIFPLIAIPLILLLFIKKLKTRKNKMILIGIYVFLHIIFTPSIVSLKIWQSFPWFNIIFVIIETAFIISPFILFKISTKNKITDDMEANKIVSKLNSSF